MSSPLLVQRQEINDLRWNQAIARADNGKIYAHATLLDLLSPGWCALILGDYKLVMPLTHREKFGIRYLFQPPFLQQLGVLGEGAAEYLPVFLETAKKDFPFAEIFLNHGNNASGLQPRKNYIINLNRPYESIAEDYSGIHHKNLKRASHCSLEYRTSSDYARAIDMSCQLYGQRSGVTKPTYDQLKKLATIIPQHILVREVWQQQECQATTFCLKDDNRIYFLLSAVTAEGRKNQANHYLVDQLIREYAGQVLIMDFEGSEIQGIGDFYTGFGAIDEPYYFCRWNHLPWPYRWFKK